ncbi:hypothetical protein [Bradyrhizobium sp. LTSP857]|uniref:hypothetical protein n=1 Tax=Bradyrhizobium sp. LTSP857 TaxID=1619231 RepID=UPI0005D26E2D|nr:hypothetical protein [Bradyrhizobium sp. LTSP857]KJC37722.1 hypothetical protein UP06_30430 [Bradyrhizobium sp. LTSP857]
MSKTKRPPAPKFEPVEIEGWSAAGRSLALSDAETASIRSQDLTRIVAQQATAGIERLDVLREYLGVPKGNFPALALAIAERYVPGFSVNVGSGTKPGRRKKPERFNIVTMIEGLAAAEQINEAEAIRTAASRKIGGRMLSPESLSTKYYAAVAEIEAHPAGAALLRLWRSNLPLDLSAEMAELFLQFETETLGAVVPNNVHVFQPRK